MTTQNYYETLGLAQFAGSAMVDQAYWHLAKTYQGLAEADPRARQALDDLNAAYAVLATPRLREEYDATLSGGRIVGRKSPAAGSSVKEVNHGSRLRLSLPRWPFGRSEEAPVAIEARVRGLGPVPANETRPGPATESNRSRRGDAQDLHTSTARMLERWRASTSNAAKASAQSEPATPDMTLVDIFKTEEELEAREDPLSAVMDILKAPKDRIPASPEG